MTKAEREIINALPEVVQELATDMIESCRAKDANKYAEAANTYDIIHNRKQFDCQVMQSFARLILSKAVEAGFIQQQPQPTPQKPQATETAPNLTAEKVVGNQKVGSASAKSKAM